MSQAQTYGALPADADVPHVHDDAEHQPRVSRSALAGMAAFAGVFAVVGASMRPPSAVNSLGQVLDATGARTTGASSGTGVPSSASGDHTLNFKAQNVYTRKNGATALGYPLIKEYKLIEPYRESTLEIDEAQDDCVYSWTVYDPNMEKVVDAKGANVTLTATSVGKYAVAIDAVCGVKQVTRSYQGALDSKYVRRELRSLTDKDKVHFFNTMEIVYKTNREEGQAKYGEYFEPIDRLVATHNQLAGSKYCDHMHDGYGFLTQHSALSKWFEVVLQAVSPDVALPYWDYTIEGQAVNNTGDIAKWRDSDVFDPQQFGPCKNSGPLTEGRFAYTVTRKNSHDYIVHAPEGHNRTEGDYAAVNAYGFMRAPWNQNNIPYLTRINNTYGFELTEVPDCYAHKQALEMDTFEDFGAFIAYTPHGTTHIAIGGVGNADYKNILKAHNYDLEMAEHWVPIAFANQKNMYRAGLLECPVTCSADTKVYDCKCTCPSLQEWLEMDEGDLWDSVMNDIMEMDEKYIYQKNGSSIEKVILKMLCNDYDGMASVMGDSLESASPNDPSFWPTHPTVERLLVWKRINGFTSDFWPSSAAWSVEGYLIDYCYGHDLDDVLPWPKHIFSPVMGPYTNKQVWELTAPSNDEATYLYDNFRWEHCEDAGYLRTLIPSNVTVDNRGV